LSLKNSNYIKTASFDNILKLAIYHTIEAVECVDELVSGCTPDITNDRYNAFCNASADLNDALAELVVLDNNNNNNKEVVDNNE